MKQTGSPFPLPAFLLLDGEDGLKHHQQQCPRQTPVEWLPFDDGDAPYANEAVKGEQGPTDDSFEDRDGRSGSPQTRRHSQGVGVRLLPPLLLRPQMLLYVHRDHKGRGAQDGHLDLHTAPEL